MKSILILFPVLFFSISLFSQDVEYKILNNLTNNISYQWQYYLLKQKYDGILITEDPATGEKDIYYDEKLDRKLKEEFAMLDEDEKFKILYTENLPIFPLNDTITIINQSNLFSMNNIIFKTENDIVFHFSDVEDTVSKSPFIKVESLHIYKDTLILVVSFHANNVVEKYSYYFDLKESDMKITKKSWWGHRW